MKPAPDTLALSRQLGVGSDIWTWNLPLIPWPCPDNWVLEVTFGPETCPWYLGPVQTTGCWKWHLDLKPAPDTLALSRQLTSLVGVGSDIWTWNLPLIPWPCPDNWVLEVTFGPETCPWYLGPVQTTGCWKWHLDLKPAPDTLALSRQLTSLVGVGSDIWTWNLPLIPWPCPDNWVLEVTFGPETCPWYLGPVQTTGCWKWHLDLKPAPDTLALSRQLGVGSDIWTWNLPLIPWPCPDNWVLEVTFGPETCPWYLGPVQTTGCWKWHLDLKPAPDTLALSRQLGVGSDIWTWNLPLIPWPCPDNWVLEVTFGPETCPWYLGPVQTTGCWKWHLDLKPAPDTLALSRQLGVGSDIWTWNLPLIPWPCPDNWVLEVTFGPETCPWYLGPVQTTGCWKWHLDLKPAPDTLALSRQLTSLVGVGNDIWTRICTAQFSSSSDISPVTADTEYSINYLTVEHKRKLFILSCQC